ncbi:pyridoxine/pyridoxamine 5'-phosphate oxidase 1, chloroplastic isoform X2 [Setaria viridis]|uniref:pyridoxine/pyridoxamine 5'-phosphate oxidase 1, chloroplastic isoform X2 n=1 Tax=Setaria viridis TaxID=4556 RepID=UPI001493C4D3|nr:pyridoxine/pyridoxamine 5'-phosphate oxidase 1, chloroplastic isoform X2 [Setaria viridis]
MNQLSSSIAVPCAHAPQNTVHATLPLATPVAPRQSAGGGSQSRMLAVASRARDKSATTILSLAMPFLPTTTASATATATNPRPLVPSSHRCKTPTPHLRPPPPVRRLPILPAAPFLPLPPRRGMASLAASAAAAASAEVTHLTQRDAAEIDEQLMGPLGFSVDQLMELAGLSVAEAVAEVYKLSEHTRVLIICGPGNNGGDGLVAARHLYHFGYRPSVCYPKRTPKPLYSGLVTQLESLSIPFITAEDLPDDLSREFDIIIDAMFGFSFHGTPRPPFDDLIQRLVSLAVVGNSDKRPAIVSIDVPSGWHVEEGDVDGGIKPDMLVSLTAPKLCAKKFTGPHHFLGGRFIPPPILNKYGLQLPPYPGTSMCVRIGKAPSVDISSLRENYISPELLESQVMPDPFDQFRKWFDEAVTAGLREPNAMALTTVNKEGKPSSRMVLLKGVDKQGFVWYTNYGGRKAHDLSENPNAALLFYWNEMNRQVRVEGSVEKVPEEESEKYFHSRPRGSQLGAIVSKQSTVIAGREVLQQAYKELEQKYSDGREKDFLELFLQNCAMWIFD